MADTVKLKGKVTQADEPVKGASVKVFDGTELKGECATSDDGSYQISELEKNKPYKVKVFIDGEEEYSEEISIETATKTMNITIEPIPASPSVPEPLEFGNLTSLIKTANFRKEKAVEINEALEFRRLFRVGNLIMAQVPQAIEKLNHLLTSNLTDIGLTISKKENLLDKHGELINTILIRKTEDFNNEESLLREVRRQFDLGTGAVEGVNIDFKKIYQEFAALCSDDLLSINPQTVDKSSFGPDKEEELYELLRKLRRNIIKLTGNMSVAGTLGTRSLTKKWSSILHDSLVVIDEVAREYVPYDDTDKRHVWYVTAALNGKQKRDIDPYIVQANEGATMLYYAINIYDKIKEDLKKEDRNHLFDLFHNIKFVKEDDPPKEDTASNLLKENVSLVLENWIPDWS